MTSRTQKRAKGSSPALKSTDATSRPDAAGFAPKGCRRLDGPTSPPPGTPMPIHGIRHLEERLERLAFPAEEVIRDGRAPLETYTTTTSEHGDIYRATDAYVAWLGSRLPGYGGLDRVSRAPTRPSLEEVGGIEGGRSAWLNGRMKKAA